MTTVEILEKARDLISDPERWAKGYYAHDKDGDYVPPRDGNACKWCAAGATIVVSPDDDNDDSRHALALLQKALPSGFLFATNYNDRPTTTHADILALFDRAIELAKAEQVSA